MPRPVLSTLLRRLASRAEQQEDTLEAALDEADEANRYADQLEKVVMRMERIIENFSLGLPVETKDVDWARRVSQKIMWEVER